jgi:ABC-2 type transport system permease protein
MSEPIRPLYWSLRRELWENRAIYLAPIAVAAVMLLSFTFTVVGLPHRSHPADTPYKTSAAMLILTGVVVGVFYSADALHGERRDRSILFWKSLPVSDLTTVISKLATPLVTIPVVTFAIVLVTHVFMLELSLPLLITHGMDPRPVLNSFNPLILLYGLAAISLWLAPVYAYFILMSAWARRHPFIWAIVPLIVIGVLEHVLFASQHFGAMLRDRLMGFAPNAFEFKPTPRGHIPEVQHLTPDRFLGNPDLWLGLLFAAVCVVAAVRLRRNREPI